MRIKNHPILGVMQEGRVVQITIDGNKVDALEGEPIAAALIANGIRALRKTRKRQESRGIFCAIGRCTDCMMIVNGIPNIRTCITPIRAGMKVGTQIGFGKK